MMLIPLTSQRSSSTGGRTRDSLQTHVRRLLIALLIALLALLALAFAPQHVHARSLTISPRPYYLGLGDSLAFGYQPNFNWSHGYVQQWDSNLQSHGVKYLTNYGCLGETSTTFINGGCPYSWLLHNYYSGSQLSAAVKYLAAHAGQVSPVSLDIGANDLLPDINSSTCTVSSTWTTDLNRLDTNLSTIILPDLVKALTSTKGVRTGQLVMMNYYDPYQNTCPNSVANLQAVNAVIAKDAAAYGIPVADVFTAFGGATVPDPDTCSYTWICSSSADIHATTQGYGVIAGAFERATGY